MGGLGTRVTLTDRYEKLVDCVADAVLDNHLQAQCTASVYEWGQESSPLHDEDFDVILGAGVGRHVTSRRHVPCTCEHVTSPSVRYRHAGADCFYSHGTAGAFCDALDLLAREPSATSAGTRVLVTCGERWSTVECLEVCRERGWGVTQLGDDWSPSDEQLAQVSTGHREQSDLDGRCRTYEMARLLGPSARAWHWPDGTARRRDRERRPSA